MKSYKNSLRSNLRLAKRARSQYRSRQLPKRAILWVALFFVFSPANSFASKTAQKPPAAKSAKGLEGPQDLIQKAQNLTLQRDRLQASQILVRALGRETRGSAAFKDMTKALSELSTVFYTEKAQSVFNVGESALATRPRDAIDSFQEALRLEDGNVTVLKALARAQLSLGDCDKAETSVRAAETIDPYSSEVQLLSLQTLACNKSYDALSAKLEETEGDVDPTETNVRNLRYGLQIQALSAVKLKPDLKKAKALLASWEAADAEYPETFYWKYFLSKLSGAPDRTAAVRYTHLCQNLSARKRKNYSLDVNLCKGKEAVESYLKESGLSSTPSGTP